MIKDNVRKKSHIVFADILAQKPDRLRIDITTSLGIHLARLTMNEESLNYILPRERKYFSGTPRAEALKPILGASIDPKLLMNLLFEQEPADWKCERDTKNFLKSCVQTNSSMKIEWSSRDHQRRTVALKSKTAEIQLELNGFQPKVEAGEEAFTIKIPTSYKEIRIKE